MNSWNLENDQNFRENILNSLSTIAQAKIDRMDASELWMEVKSTDNVASSVSPPRRNDQPRKSWISDSTWNSVKDCRKIKIKKPTSGSDSKSGYTRLTNALDRAMRMDKETYLVYMQRNTQTHTNQETSSRKFDLSQKGFQPRYFPVKDENRFGFTTKSGIVVRLHNIAGT